MKKESRIEDFAFEYLQSYYKNKQQNPIFVSKNEQTKRGVGVDGLFTYKADETSYFISALTTCYSSELASLLTNYKKKGLSRWRFLSAVLLATAAAFLFHNFFDTAFTMAFSLLVLTGTFILHTVLEKVYLKNRITKIVTDLKSIPANEQWLGISISSLIFRKNDLADILLSACKNRGIGLITVGKRAKIICFNQPETINCRKGDFLSYYAAEESIKTAIAKNKVLRVA